MVWARKHIGPALTITTWWSVSLGISQPSAPPAVNTPAVAIYLASVCREEGTTLDRSVP